MAGEETGAGREPVRATVNYIRNRPVPGACNLEFVSEAEERSTMQTLPGREVFIRSARGLHTSLDREGFRLVGHESGITDFDGIELDPERKARYTQEMCDLVLKETGASRVIALDGAKQRFGESAIEQLAPLLNAKPARYPHADNTDESSAGQISMFASLLPDLDVDDFSRVALYNLWRCVSPPPQDCPLALCDARSIAAADEVSVTAVTEVHGIGEVRHETTSYTYNTEHRWFYFPDMSVDELIIFKTHDTDDARARRVAHTAFDDPTCPPGTSTRASVEARIMALYS